MAESEGPKQRRFNARRKREVVLRLMRGQDLDAVSREVGITAAKLAEWRRVYMTAGEADLKNRESDPRDEKIAHLKSIVGDLTMRNEILQIGIRKLQGQAIVPLDAWKSKK